MNQTNSKTQKTSKTSLETYEDLQAQIQKTLKKIELGLEAHDRRASEKPGGHNWATVGDLEHYLNQLKDISDSLNHEGQYAPENCQTLKTYRAYNANGQAVKVTIPER